MIKICPVPDSALLSAYSTAGTYTDCYVVVTSAPVTFAQYVIAFYTTPIFKLERFILRLALSKPSTDTQVEQLANGLTNKFAAWKVEARAENQLLMCDIHGRTRSWLMLVPDENSESTQLYFGSAVVPIKHRSTGRLTLGFGFTALLGLHKLYSKILLASAIRKIRKAT